MKFGSIDAPVYVVSEDNSYGKFGDHHSLVIAIIVLWSSEMFS